MDRRTFLQMSGLAGCGLFAPVLWANNAEPVNTATKTLVLVELKGGNDGINTLIPYADEQYQRLRPKLAIPAKDVIPVSNTVGMHPALQPLYALWETQEMAWIQGMGYANPIRSHFHAIDVWDSADPEEKGEVTEGWVSRALVSDNLRGVAVNCALGPLLCDDLSSIGLVNPVQFARMGKKLQAVDTNKPASPGLMHVLEVQNSVDALANRFLKKIVNAPVPATPFPKHPFSRDLNSVYSLMVAGLDIPVFKVSLGGFDTHVNQLARQERLFKMLAEGLDVFVKNLKASGLWENTLIMSYSEFGRRLQENASAGTDHGAAAPHFVLGGSVKGGLYGSYPSLTNLDDRGDLIFTTDFRDVYNTIVTQWWGLPGISGKSIDFLQQAKSMPAKV